MNRFRHPIRAIREPFGTAGLIIACVALVAALGGTALAASGALTGKQKKEVEKIAKKYAGKPGQNGTNGANGAAGPAGPKGDTGAKGDIGATGATGPKGTTGLTGATGTTGTTGSPWTAGGVLPEGATETGAWSFGQTKASLITSSISFPIPLASAPTLEVVESTPTANCSGSAANPTAEPGFLCIYVALGTVGSWPVVQGSGAVMTLFNFAEAGLQGYGSFAVTAE